MSTPDFYRHALAYDIAFGDRDFAGECDFLAWCLQEHGRPNQLCAGWSNATSGSARPSFLEIACGPAQHAREFARRGWRAVGLDMSTDMLDYALQGALQDGAILETICADMCDFNLAQPVALAANMMESITHLVTNDQVVRHLRTVAQNLVVGGLYVLEMAHPSGLWRDSLPNSWTSARNDTVVDFVFGLEDDSYDWITQQWTMTARLTITEPGQPVKVMEQHNNHRWYQAQEFAALVDLSAAFTQRWWYGDMLIPPPPLDNGPAAVNMILVLRK
jgi:SAM-dependent methyltransferase